MSRYALVMSDEGRRYVIPVLMLDDFKAWNALDEDDPKGWEDPAYAYRLEGGLLTFDAPEYDGKSTHGDWGFPNLSNKGMTDDY